MLTEVRVTTTVAAGCSPRTTHLSYVSPFMPARTVGLSFLGHGLLPDELSAVEGVSKQVSGLQ